MRALQLETLGRLHLQEMHVPSTKPHETLIKVSHCALCRTDAKMWLQGQRDLVLPRVLGHEIFGYSAETGKGFVVWPGRACGVCRYCRDDLENLCPHMSVLGFHRHGGLAEQVSVPESSLIPAPENLTGRLACLAEPLACTLNALEAAGVSNGTKVLIYGGGPVGLMMALAARTRGAFPFLVEKNPSKLRRSADFRKTAGIEGALDCGTSDFDAAVNAAPSLATLSEGLPRLRSGGRFCLFSGIPGDETVPASLVNEIHYRQLLVTGAYGCTRRQMQDALRILVSEEEAAGLLVEDQIPLEEVPAALGAILSGNALKFVVKL